MMNTNVNYEYLIEFEHLILRKAKSLKLRSKMFPEIVSQKEYQNFLRLKYAIKGSEDG